MAVIGFGFTKINCFRAPAHKSGKIEISHNVMVDNVSSTKLNASSSEVLKVDFTFVVRYSDGLGEVALSGDVVYSDIPELVKESLNMWTTEKKLPELVNNEVSKFIYTKGITKALALSDELNLPAPIPVVPQGMFEQKK